MSFGVPFGGLQEMLRHLFEVAPCDEGKLLARLRNMQREGFPPGTNVGRGAKVAYSVEQLAAVLFLHMLVDAGFPPDFAIQLFKAHRTDILAVAVQDGRSLEAGDNWPGPATKMIVVSGCVISPSDAGGRHGLAVRPLPARLSVLMFVELQDRLKELIERPSGVHLIDLARFLGRGLAHLAARQLTTIEDAGSAMAELRSSLS